MIAELFYLPSSGTTEYMICPHRPRKNAFHSRCVQTYLHDKWPVIYGQSSIYSHYAPQTSQNTKSNIAQTHKKMRDTGSI